jgi:uncharacterized protein YecT (DUF1311 family)
MRRSPLLLVFALALSTPTLLGAQQSPDAVRFKALDKTIEGAPPEQRVAYNALLVAFTTYRDARLREICSGYHGCRETLQTEKSNVNAGFLPMAEGHPREGFPSFTTDELTVADASLNEAFEKVLAGLAVTCSGRDSGCLSQATFRDVQRDWIRYRDAWVTFAGLRWPQVTPESWLTLLTRERTAQINQLPRPVS